MVPREGVSVREAARRLRSSSNTAARWLADPGMVGPKCPPRVSAASLLDQYKEQLWLKADSQRGNRDRRSIGSYFQSIRAIGYAGGKTRVYRYCQRWRRKWDNAPRKAGVATLSANFTCGSTKGSLILIKLQKIP